MLQCDTCSNYILYVDHPLLLVVLLNQCIEYPSAPTVNVMSVGMDSISLSWEISKACFESVNFTTAIILKSVSDGQTHAAFVSGNSHAFTGLTSGTSYNITVFAIGDRLQSDSMSTTATTSTGKHFCIHCIFIA